MGQINRTGTFRGIDVNRVVNKSSGGHYQWVADLVATQYYDEDTGEWVDWFEYEEREIRCYIMLVNREIPKGEFFGAPQLLKAGRWAALSFQELRNEPPENLLFQFNVIEDTYDGTTRLKVNRVDSYDAEPGRTLEGLDDDEAKKLDAQYAAVLQKLRGGAKPKSVPGKPPVPKPEAPAPAPTPSADKEAAKAALKEQTVEKAKRGKKAEAKAAKREKSAARPAKPPIPKAVPAPTPEPESETEPDINVTTKNDAYNNCYIQLVESGTATVDQLNNIWVTTVEEQGGDDALDGEGWAAVRNSVLDELREVPI